MTRLIWQQFFLDECGQDYTEYALMLAAVTLFAGALFLMTMADIETIWTTLNSYISAGAS
jgi:Flp pilus assembly pilin Flp